MAPAGSVPTRVSIATPVGLSILISAINVARGNVYHEALLALVAHAADAARATSLPADYLLIL
jgi:hypothetical protein